MSVQIRDTSYKKKSESWNDMEELKNLICAIDAWYVQLIVSSKKSELSRVSYAVEEKCLTNSFRRLV